MRFILTYYEITDKDKKVNKKVIKADNLTVARKEATAFLGTNKKEVFFGNAKYYNK